MLREWRETVQYEEKKGARCNELRLQEKLRRRLSEKKRWNKYLTVERCWPPSGMNAQKKVWTGWLGGLVLRQVAACCRVSGKGREGARENIVECGREREEGERRKCGEESVLPSPPPLSPLSLLSVSSHLISLSTPSQLPPSPPIPFGVSNTLLPTGVPYETKRIDQAARIGDGQRVWPSPLIIAL